MMTVSNISESYSSFSWLILIILILNYYSYWWKLWTMIFVDLIQHFLSNSEKYFLIFRAKQLLLLIISFLVIGIKLSQELFTQFSYTTEKSFLNLFYIIIRQVSQVLTNCSIFSFIFLQIYRKYSNFLNSSIQCFSYMGSNLEFFFLFASVSTSVRNFVLL